MNALIRPETLPPTTNPLAPLTVLGLLGAGLGREDEED